MKLFFSGNSSRDSVPEHLLHATPPDVMLTYYDFYLNPTRDTMRRFRKHCANRAASKPSTPKKKKKA